MPKEMADGTSHLRQSADLQIGGRFDINPIRYILGEYLYCVSLWAVFFICAESEIIREYNGCHDINQCRGFHVTMAITV